MHCNTEKGRSDANEEEAEREQKQAAEVRLCCRVEAGYETQFIYTVLRWKRFALRCVKGLGISKRQQGFH